MKLLESINLDRLNSILFTSNIQGRIESYSCKMAGDDKRLFKVLSHDAPPNELAALAPPQTMLSVSPNTSSYSRSLGSADEGENPLNHVCSRKTLYYLISTLNASFRPDYDFSNAKSEEFSREPSVTWVQNFIDSTLGAVLGEQYYQLHSMLWNNIDEEITLRDCNVYSYNPDLESDPYGDEGCVWSFNFFLYNHKLKRILFFTCKAQTASPEDDSGIGGDDDEEEEEDMDFFVGIEDEINIPITVE